MRLDDLESVLRLIDERAQIMSMVETLRYGDDAQTGALTYIARYGVPDDVLHLLAARAGQKLDNNTRELQALGVTP